jgi:hypothetical protein
MTEQLWIRTWRTGQQQVSESKPVRSYVTLEPEDYKDDLYFRSDYVDHLIQQERRKTELLTRFVGRLLALLPLKDILEVGNNADRLVAKFKERLNGN